MREPNDVVIVYTTSANPEYKGLMWRCAGCAQVHQIPTSGNGWEWNGSTTAPTLTPSILTHGDPNAEQPRCHSFVTNGVVRFLADCDHGLAGQSVRMLPEDADPFAKGQKEGLE